MHTLLVFNASIKHGRCRLRPRPIMSYRVRCAMGRKQGEGGARVGCAVREKGWVLDERQATLQHVPPIAQLVERETVAVYSTDISRSLVRIRVGGFLLAPTPLFSSFSFPFSPGSIGCSHVPARLPARARSYRQHVDTQQRHMLPA